MYYYIHKIKKKQQNKKDSINLMTKIKELKKNHLKI